MPATSRSSTRWSCASPTPTGVFAAAEFVVVRKLLCASLSHIKHLRRCRARINVLVPGAGLGRLVFDLAYNGFAAQGNEWSVFMLLASNLILNGFVRSQQQQQLVACSSAHSWVLWLHPMGPGGRAASTPPSTPLRISTATTMARTTSCVQCRSRTSTHTPCPRDPTCPWPLATFWKSTPSPVCRGLGSSSNASRHSVIYSPLLVALTESWDCIASAFFLDTARNICAYIDVGKGGGGVIFAAGYHRHSFLSSPDRSASGTF